MNIQLIKNTLINKRFKITNHAFEEAEKDQLSFDEIYDSVHYGEIIEDYPRDTPYPSCLIYGQSFNGDPIHSVWAYNKEKDWSVLVTVYRPDPNKWLNWIKRKSKP